MEQIQLSIPEGKPAEKDTIGNRIKKVHKQVSPESSELTTMTSVSVFEEMTASHRFEIQSETRDDHQQSRKFRKCFS